MKSKLEKIGMIALYVFGLGSCFFTYTANNEPQVCRGDSSGKQYWCNRWNICCDRSYPYSCSTSNPC